METENNIFEKKHHEKYISRIADNICIAGCESTTNKFFMMFFFKNIVSGFPKRLTIISLMLIKVNSK